MVKKKTFKHTLSTFRQLKDGSWRTTLKCTKKQKEIIWKAAKALGSQITLNDLLYQKGKGDSIKEAAIGAFVLICVKNLIDKERGEV